MINNPSVWRFCIAPMMKYTDRHFRYFARIMSSRARLYTEMIVAPAITKGDKDRFLRHHEQETPVALQLGGSHPQELAEAAKIGEQYGYSEINLNVGCPSDRVQSGDFGACLMAKPGLVAECVAAIKAVVGIPVTVKCRIGIDEQDSYEFLHNFVKRLIEVPIDALLVHARKAILSGLTPLQNRTIPPLRYDTVYQLKTDFPNLAIVINGGISDIPNCDQHLQHCDGVMLGRAACANPYLLTGVDAFVNGLAPSPALSRAQVVGRYLPYLADNWQSNASRSMMIKPLYGLYLGQPGAKQWRRNLNAAIHKHSPPAIEDLLPTMNAH